jgi:hypothetical protein
VKPDPPEEYDGKAVLLSGLGSLDIGIKGNPFIKVAPTTKYFKMIEKTDTTYRFRVLDKVAGVPYSDCFAIEEDWIIISPNATANCCILRISLQVIFYKSTIFKYKI